MSQRNADSEVLARWHYSPEQWRDFTGHERELQRFELSDELTKHRTTIVVGGAFAVVMSVLAGGLPGLAIVSVLLVGFLLIAVIIHQIMRKAALQGMEAMNGEVWIMPDGVCTNGMWFGWAGRDRAWRLRTVRLTTISNNLGKAMEVLEFKCLGSVVIRGQRTTIDKEWRVPVPAGQEAAASAIVTRLIGTRHPESEDAEKRDPLSILPGPSGSPSQAEGFLGHDFAGGVCSKCGSTVEAIHAFEWACKV